MSTIRSIRYSGEDSRSDLYTTPFGLTIRDNNSSNTLSKPNLIQESVNPHPTGPGAIYSNTIRHMKYIQSDNSIGTYNIGTYYTQNSLDAEGQFTILMNPFIDTTSSKVMYKVAANIIITIKIDNTLSGDPDSIYVRHLKYDAVILGTNGSATSLIDAIPTIVTENWSIVSQNSDNISTYIYDPTATNKCYVSLSSNTLTIYVTARANINYSIDTLTELDIISTETN
jgi:hypothetical protein